MSCHFRHGCCRARPGSSERETTQVDWNQGVALNKRRRSMSKVRPFRFGVAAESALSREEWITLVRRVEDLGYATFLLADHYVNEFPPIAALMAAADASRTLRIGSIVFDNDFRHPALLAKEVATLDLLS